MSRFGPRRETAVLRAWRGRRDGVDAMPRRLDVVIVVAWESTRLAREPRPCRDGVVHSQVLIQEP